MTPSQITLTKVTKKELEKAGFQVGSYAAEMLKKVEFSGETVDLVVKTTKEITGKDGYSTTQELYDAAKKQGLELCPAAVGPCLRLAYQDQPQYEYLRIAMEPITDAGDDLRVFYISHDSDDRWLHSHYGGPVSTWFPGYLWVFQLPRNGSSTSDPLSKSSLTLSTLSARLAVLEEKFEKLKNL